MAMDVTSRRNGPCQHDGGIVLELVSGFHRFIDNMIERCEHLLIMDFSDRSRSGEASAESSDQMSIACICQELSKRASELSMRRLIRYCQCCRDFKGPFVGDNSKMWGKAAFVLRSSACASSSEFDLVALCCTLGQPMTGIRRKEAAEMARAASNDEVGHVVTQKSHAAPYATPKRSK